jgi:NAD+ kinase
MVVFNNIIHNAIVICRPTPRCFEKTKRIIEALRKYNVSVNSYWVDDLIREVKVKPDLIVSIGGDGTLLKISRVFQYITPPILPIPCGRRTSLYEDINDDELEDVIDKVMKGFFTIDILDRINVFYNNKQYTALNEVSLISVDRGKVIGFEIYVKTPILTSKYYVEGDGVLIGPSTGSAAYNLSAGGSLIDYFIEAMFITVLNPMELNISPIIVPSLSKIIVKTKGFTELYVDGEKKDVLGPKREVSIEYSDKGIRIIRFYSKKNIVRDVFDKRILQFI